MAVDPYVSDPDFVLYHGDALELLPELGEVADCVVTSPPYADARRDVRPVHAGVSVDRPGFVDWLAELLRACTGAVGPNGGLMLNLGRLHRDGEELDYWMRAVLQARQAGWRWLDHIIWGKANGGGGKNSPYLIDRHEHVFWLARSLAAYRGFDEARQPYSPATLARYTRKYSGKDDAYKGSDRAPRNGRTPHPDGAKPGSLFITSVGADKGIDHPTPMAIELAEFLVLLSCPPGGTVLDPCAGSCTTALAARKHGRRAICIEVDEAHCQEAAARLVQLTLNVT